MKIDATFLGKRFYIGSYKGQDAIFIEQEIEQAKEKVRKAALKHFEDLVQDAKDRLEKTKPSRVYRKFPNLISVPPAIAPLVTAPEPVTRRRRQEPEPVPEPVTRRRAPEPAPVPTPAPAPVVELEPAPAPQEPYVSDWEINDKTVKNTPLFVEYDGVNKTAKDPLTDKIYDLKQYESKLSIKFDKEHIYWYDYATNKFAFKTYNN